MTPHQQPCACVRVSVRLYLCVQPQHDDHDEEADSPELRQRHHGDSSREGDEGEARTCESAVNTQLILVTQK